MTIEVSTQPLGSVVSSVLPEPVPTVVTGREPLGACLASHAGLRHVTFTGSVPTGRAVARGAGASLARVTLESGGNDAAVRLGDVDVDGIAGRLFRAAFRKPARVERYTARAPADGARAAAGGRRLGRPWRLYGNLGPFVVHRPKSGAEPATEQLRDREPDGRRPDADPPSRERS